MILLDLKTEKTFLPRDEISRTLTFSQGLVHRQTGHRRGAGGLRSEEEARRNVGAEFQSICPREAGKPAVDAETVWQQCSTASNQVEQLAPTPGHGRCNKRHLTPSVKRRR